MRIVFYAMFGVVSLLGSWYVASGLFGRLSLGSLSPLLSRVALLLAALAGCWQLHAAFLAGEREGRWLAATGHTIAALVLCQGLLTIIFFANTLLRR